MARLTIRKSNISARTAFLSILAKQKKSGNQFQVWHANDSLCYRIPIPLGRNRNKRRYKSIQTCTHLFDTVGRKQQQKGNKEKGKEKEKEKVPRAAGGKLSIQYWARNTNSIKMLRDRPGTQIQFERSKTTTRKADQDGAHSVAQCRARSRSWTLIRIPCRECEPHQSDQSRIAFFERLL